MADSPAPARVYDLGSSVPGGWTLSGLSGPKSDGVNAYRTPTVPRSTLTFEAKGGQFVQYRYQLYSPKVAVRGRALLDGRLFDAFTFPPGKYLTREVNASVPPGQHVLTTELDCGPAACPLPEIRQYWTRLSLTPVPRSSETVGPGVLGGLSGLKWDGANAYRIPTAPRSTLTFEAKGGQFVQYRYQLSSPNVAVRGRVSLDGRLLDTFTFPPGKYLTRELNTSAAAGHHVLTTELDCGPAACPLPEIHQYWTRLSLVPAPASSANVGPGVLGGLSEPKWDGANVYRTPTAPRSTLTFEAKGGQFVQYRYQLSSPKVAVRGRVSLGGRLIDTFTFPPGKYLTRELSSFAPGGRNVLTTELDCGPAACPLPELRQYRTRLSLVPTPAPTARVAPGVQRWWLDAPGSPLSGSGTGPPLYDGVNFLRAIGGRGFTLSWPAGTRPLDASVQLVADQPFRATFLVGDQLLLRRQGAPGAPVAPTVSLGGFPQARSLTVRVDCLKTPALPCARAYFTRVSAFPPASAAPPPLAGMALPVIGGLLGLLLLGWLLGLPTRRPA